MNVKNLDCYVCEETFVPYQLIMIEHNLICGSCEKSIESEDKEYNEAKLEMYESYMTDSDFHSRTL